MKIRSSLSSPSASRASNAAERVAVELEASLMGIAVPPRRSWRRHVGRGIRAEYVTRTVRALAERDPFAAYMQLCTYSTALERARVLGCTEGEVSNRAVWRRHREIFESLPLRTSYLPKVMALDLNVYLPGRGLACVDRAAMEHGVEVRVPWLDLELVRWSLHCRTMCCCAGDGASCCLSC
jgi:asparagine synthase (glutamine-hydrolysing)